MVTKITVFEPSQGKGKRVSLPVDFHILRQILGPGLGWEGGVYLLIAFQNYTPGFESMWKNLT